KNFNESKQRDIIVHEKYLYSDSQKKWISQKKIKIEKDIEKAYLFANEKEFNYTNPIKFEKKKISIYKEIVYFNLKGKEMYKVSSINKNLKDISKKNNTYINSETYYNKIQNLKKGEIYVSSVIGENVKTSLIGMFTKEKAKKMSSPFAPALNAYAGVENPNGVKFEGIIRFITPVFKNEKKIGFISLALDHEHIMQFTDTVDPMDINHKQNIADASKGNYAFMWDNKGRNISHARDYFIVGYDKNTGKKTMPWLSKDVAYKFDKSQLEINDFLKAYPKFEHQTLKKKPNIMQLKEQKQISLDCRYLNFAPQCNGWMQVTKDGGHGSFVIFWAGVWKLTTAAAIPYYTGQYKNSKRGFGFVTIGANTDKFHEAAVQSKTKVANLLIEQTKSMKSISDENEKEVNIYVDDLVKKLTLATIIMILLMIFVALLMSRYIRSKIEKLLIGTKKFANNDFDYKIEVSSKDEIGELENSFNLMSLKIKSLLAHEKILNEGLELKIEEEISKRREQEQVLAQQSRLAGMGEMIGNIAHQWRQPLNALGLVIQNIKFSYDIGDLDDEYMERSAKKAKLLTASMSSTIDDFRNFFSPNKEKDVFDLNNIIEKTLSLVESTIVQNDIQINKIYDSSALDVFGFSNELSQAILNIFNNSRDALVENNINDPFIQIITYQNNDYAVLEISDNAGGIPKEIIKKVFDPYFTTKEQGKGTGIGLYMTKTIIENNMAGRISAVNKDDGVVFKIELSIFKDESKETNKEINKIS
ncbi:MAG: HAMP domain-containing histidine kinase, partial [Campylobacteraceae bacterium]|nr:HAMP domain-containing histidine kinase [Campylobacteraceae bacterium]